MMDQVSAENLELKKQQLQQDKKEAKVHGYSLQQFLLEKKIERAFALWKETKDDGNLARYRELEQRSEMMSQQVISLMDSLSPKKKRKDKMDGSQDNKRRAVLSSGDSDGKSTLSPNESFSSVPKEVFGNADDSDSQSTSVAATVLQKIQAQQTLDL